MSEDEVMICLFSVVIALVAWGRWYWLLGSIAAPAGRSARRLLRLAPLGCLLLLAAVLLTLAAHDVRDSPTYIAFYLAFGAGWLGVVRGAASPVGISWRDDALERGNRPAEVVQVALLVGLMLCFAGANIGDGPGWWCVAVAGGLATVAFIAAYAVTNAIGGFAESVSVDRDAPSAARLAGLLVAQGLILGRAAAGDWISLEQTVGEFAVGWPALPLALIAGLVERALRPSPTRPPRTDAGGAWLWSCIWLAAAALTIAMLPWPP